MIHPGQNIRIIREGRGLSALDLGQQAAIEAARYIMLENGTEEMTAVELGRISAILGISADSILKGQFMSPVRKKIRFLALDVDGVMTDEGMYFTENGDEMKKFNTKDGRAIIRAIQQGIEVAFISSGTRSEMIQARADRLGVRKVYVGKEKKVEVMERWLLESGLKWQDVACIGDDVNDLGMISKSGFSACPANAATAVIPKVDAVLSRNGGEACVREFVELFLFPID